MRLSLHIFRKTELRFFNSSGKLKAFIMFPAIVLSMISLALLYSSGGESNYYFWRQCLYYIMFFPFAILIAYLDSDFLCRIAFLVYGGIVCLLGLVAVVGSVSMGARRWIDLGFVKLQPSEFIKVGIILCLARIFHFTKFNDRLLNADLAICALIVLIPVGLIAIEPDLATAAITFGLGVLICFVCGMRSEIFLAGGALFVVSLPLLWINLHEYQKLRVLNFLNPDRDLLGSGYNIMQSKIAIGSGGFYGKGLFMGNQAHLNFLPEHQTDFIFTMLSEELGLVGCIIAIICYIGVISYGMKVAFDATSIFCKAIAGGSSILLFMHWFINAGMVMGLLPIAGVPMPLLSYGGSSVATSLTAIGLIMHADVNSLREDVIS